MKTKKGTIEKSEPIRQKSIQPIDFKNKNFDIFKAINNPNFNDLAKPNNSILSAFKNDLVAKTITVLVNSTPLPKQYNDSIHLQAVLLNLAIFEKETDELKAVPFSFNVENKSLDTAEKIQRAIAGKLNKRLGRKVEFYISVETEPHLHCHGVALLNPVEFTRKNNRHIPAFYEALHSVNGFTSNKSIDVSIWHHDKSMIKNILIWSYYGQKKYLFRNKPFVELKKKKQLFIAATTATKARAIRLLDLINKHSDKIYIQEEKKISTPLSDIDYFSRCILKNPSIRFESDLIKNDDDFIKSFSLFLTSLKGELDKPDSSERRKNAIRIFLKTDSITKRHIITNKIKNCLIALADSDTDGWTETNFFEYQKVYDEKGRCIRRQITVSKSTFKWCESTAKSIIFSCSPEFDLNPHEC